MLAAQSSGRLLSSRRSIVRESSSPQYVICQGSHKPCQLNTWPVPGRAATATHRLVHTAASKQAGIAAGNIPVIPHQQQQQPGVTGSPARSRVRRPKSNNPKPFLVRVAGRTSDIKGAAGAIVKRLKTEDMVRVAAIDSGSLLKALLSLTAANNMAQANSGQMLVFQPTLITAAAAEPPRVPEGSMVMYTSQIMQGEVMTFNTLRVAAATDPKALSKAIIARLAVNSHTVLECYGQAAFTAAIQAVAQARKGLLVRGQDAACIITSTKKADSSSQEAPPTAEDAAGEAAASSTTSSSSSTRRPTCHRLVLLECEPRRPRALLVKSTVGVSDRMPAMQAQARPPLAPAAAAAAAV